MNRFPFDLVAAQKAYEDSKLPQLLQANPYAFEARKKYPPLLSFGSASALNRCLEEQLNRNFDLPAVQARNAAFIMQYVQPQAFDQKLLLAFAKRVLDAESSVLSRVQRELANYEARGERDKECVYRGSCGPLSVWVDETPNELERQAAATECVLSRLQPEIGARAVPIHQQLYDTKAEDLILPVGHKTPSYIASLIDIRVKDLSQYNCRITGAPFEATIAEHIDSTGGAASTRMA